MPADLFPSSQILSILDSQTNDKTPDQIESEYNQKLEYDRIFDFEESKIILKRILDDWREELSKSVRNRKQRDVEVNVEQLRQSGQLDEDETMIPVRVIDTNIQREMPAYINYIKNSRRITTFRSLDNPNEDPQQIEIEFTRGMTYIKWEIPHYKMVDGAATHGDDCVEVVYDEKYPLHVGIEHIGHDMLYYPRSNKDLQQCPRIIRAYDITLNQLQSWVEKFGFSKESVDKVVDSRKDTTKANETVRIYKEYCKYQGIVYVAWFEVDASTRDWLKAPDKLNLDIVDTKTGQPKDITQYPVFMLPYRETEKPRMIDHRGRVYYDEYKQEAQTAILSGYVNKLTRSANVYGARSQEDGTGSSLKELDLKLTGGRILSNPVQFFSPDEPTPQTLSALKYFDDSNAQETNQVNFAALNREDSRKTAKEIEAAQGQQSLLNSVQLTMFSTYIREVYSFAWLIVQSQAIQNKIKFLLVPVQQPVINPLTQQPMVDQQTGQPIMQTMWVNNIPVISQVWELRAAGDVDVIERQQKINLMKQDWPVIAQTALANEFLAELVRLEYPDTGERWASILLNNPSIQIMQQLIGKLKLQLRGAIADIPDLASKLSPQDMQSINQTLQQADQVVPNQQSNQQQQPQR